MPESLFEEQRQRLSPVKRALLEKRLRRTAPNNGGTGRLEGQHIPRSTGRRGAPLSFQQQRLWQQQKLEGRPSFYNSAVRFQGAIDVSALNRALNEIVRRHEILRTTFEAAGRDVVQVVHPPQPFDLLFEDLVGLPVEDRELHVREKASEQAGRFDLSSGPLFRTTLMRLEEREYLLLFTLLHIASDHWSIRLLDHELSLLYNAFSRGRASSLSELPIQYGDFAVWQRKVVQGGLLEEQLAYWKAQLRACPAVLPLPTDFSRPPVQTFGGAYESMLIPATAAEPLRALSQRAGATLFMTLLAALQVLLHVYTGQPDVLVATGVAGRNHIDTERLVGCFINTLVIRATLSGHLTFRQVLSHVRERALSAFAHQEVPFQKLVEEVLPQPDPRYPPLAQVSFALHHGEEEAATPTQLSKSLTVMEASRAAFDLTMRAQISRQGLDCTLEYNTDLFRPVTVRRILEHYRCLLVQIGTDPDQRISALTLVHEDVSM